MVVLCFLPVMSFFLLELSKHFGNMPTWSACVSKTAGRGTEADRSFFMPS